MLGLDDRPQARPQFRRGPAASARDSVGPEDAGPGAAPAAPAAGPLTAPQVASFYQFPAGTDGTGQTVAIIELGGGYTASDLSTYFSGLGLPVPSVTAVGVDGGSNSPGQSADGEVELDIEVVGGVAPGAVQVVYFATNTDQGFIDAIAQAVHATPSPIAVSISWGQSEDQWSAQSRTAMDQAFADAAALGVTVTVAAGDNGSSDDPSEQTQVHCDFPASSPNALACGGTKLIGNPSSFAITSEVVWNELASNEGAGGGGVSDVFPLPSYQANAGVPKSAAGSASGQSGSGRGVPDVAGNADPVTGYLVVVDGQREPIGGTSAVAPLWAGLIARLAQATGKRFGLLQPILYAGAAPGPPPPGSTTSSRATTAPTRPARAGTPAPASGRRTAPRCSPCSAAPPPPPAADGHAEAIWPCGPQGPVVLALGATKALRGSGLACRRARTISPCGTHGRLYWP